VSAASILPQAPETQVVAPFQRGMNANLEMHARKIALELTSSRKGWHRAARDTFTLLRAFQMERDLAPDDVDGFLVWLQSVTKTVDEPNGIPKATGSRLRDAGHALHAGFEGTQGKLATIGQLLARGKDAPTVRACIADGSFPKLVEEVLGHKGGYPALRVTERASELDKELLATGYEVEAPVLREWLYEFVQEYGGEWAAFLDAKIAAAADLLGERE
jgi:hypothetical protein